MNIVMAGLDYETSSLAQREKLAFSPSKVTEFLETLKAEGIPGVLLSTCNRSELYLSYETEMPSPVGILSAMAEINPGEFAFVSRQGEECLRHLFQLTCGMKSQILGEDQILSQVKQAAHLAQENGTMDGTLNTLFRMAVTCGKEARTQIAFRSLSTSAGQSAVNALLGDYGSLQDKKILVIGNGAMGRLTASLLVAQKAQVWMTLRSYRHGETIVPQGCQIIPYDQRYGHIHKMDVVISATTSPHHTITEESLSTCASIPGRMVDLAVPRDIDPACGAITQLWNVDDLGDHRGLDEESQEKLENILQKHQEKFIHWQDYGQRQSLCQ